MRSVGLQRGAPLWGSDVRSVELQFEVPAWTSNVGCALLWTLLSILLLGKTLRWAQLRNVDLPQIVHPTVGSIVGLAFGVGSIV